MKRAFHALALVVMMAGFAGFAKAALPALAWLLVDGAADLAAGVLVRNTAGEVVATGLVAANDASWTAAGAGWWGLGAAVAASLGIGAAPSGGSEVQVPLRSTVTVPPAAFPVGTGTFDAPLAANDAAVRVTAGGSFCYMVGAITTDGLAHSLSGTYAGAGALIAACAAMRAQYLDTAKYQYVTSPSWIYGDSNHNDTTPIAVVKGGLTYYVRRFYTCEGKQATTDADSCWTGYSLSLVEPADGQRRLVWASGGWKPDIADPDWTPEQLAAWQAGKALSVVGPVGRVDVAHDESGNVYVQAMSEASPSTVLRRSVALDSSSATQSVTEEVVPTTNPSAMLQADPATLSSGIATEASGSASSNPYPGADYARQGEAAAAAETIASKLDVGPMSTDGVSSSQSAVDTANHDRDEQIAALGGSGAHMPTLAVDWVPSLLPGGPTACHPLPVSASITHGPAAGLAVNDSIDICDHLDTLREVFGWLFSVSTVFFVVHALFRANGGNAV